MYTIKDGKALVAKDAGGDRLCLYLSSNTDKAYTIPENITALGLSAFGYNNYLEELTFSSALSDILGRMVMCARMLLLLKLRI